VLATNKDLEQAVARGEFREDLYYRIHVVALEMPPLRARASDIASLAEHFLRRYAELHGHTGLRFTPAALTALTEAPWPGNVRQLENVVERAVVLGQGDRVDLADLPPLARPPAAGATATATASTPARAEAAGAVLPWKDAIAVAERDILVQALAKCGGNRERAAKALGIDRSTLFHKLRKHGVR
jgi:DNA-binding NtrC family response regulator